MSFSQHMPTQSWRSSTVESFRSSEPQQGASAELTMRELSLLAQELWSVKEHFRQSEQSGSRATTSISKVGRLIGHSRPGCPIASLADGRLVSAGGDGDLRVWGPLSRELQSPSPLSALIARRPGRFVSLAAAADGSFASVDSHGNLEVWRELYCGSWSAASFPNCSAPVSCLAWLPNGQLAAGGHDGSVTIFRPTSSASWSQRIVGYHEGPVLQVVAGDCGEVATVGADRRLMVWSPSGHEISSVGLPNQSPDRPSFLQPAEGGGFVVGDSVGCVMVQAGSNHIELQDALPERAQLVSPFADGRVVGYSPLRRCAYIWRHRSGPGWEIESSLAQHQEDSPGGGQTIDLVPLGRNAVAQVVESSRSGLLSWSTFIWGPSPFLPPLWRSRLCVAEEESIGNGRREGPRSHRLVSLPGARLARWNGDGSITVYGDEN